MGVNNVTYDQIKSFLDSLGIEYKEYWNEKTKSPYLRIEAGTKNVISNKDSLMLEFCFDSNKNFHDITLWDWE